MAVSISTGGSARLSHCWGRGFDSPMLHYNLSENAVFGHFFCSTTTKTNRQMDILNRFFVQCVSRHYVFRHSDQTKDKFLYNENRPSRAAFTLPEIVKSLIFSHFWPLGRSCIVAIPSGKSALVYLKTADRHESRSETKTFCPPSLFRGKQSAVLKIT